LDPNILLHFARAFGLGQSAESLAFFDVPGTVPDPAWKEKNIGPAWLMGDGVNLAIGQGYLLSTPLQMANAFFRPCQPRLGTNAGLDLPDQARRLVPW